MSNAVPKKETRNAIIVACFGLAFAALCAWIQRSMISAGGDPRHAQCAATKERLDRLIESEVPMGCDRAQVQSWFDKHGVQHSYSADMTGDLKGNKTMPMLAGLRHRDLMGMERGLIEEGPMPGGPDADVFSLNGGRITIYFFFDKQGRMVGHLVDCFVYCL